MKCVYKEFTFHYEGMTLVMFSGHYCITVRTAIQSSMPSLNSQDTALVEHHYKLQQTLQICLLKWKWLKENVISWNLIVQTCHSC